MASNAARDALQPRTTAGSGQRHSTAIANIGDTPSAARGGKAAFPAICSMAPVKSADRVLQMLSLLGESERRLRASEIGCALNIPISSCMALLATAVGRGFVSFDEGDRSYALAKAANFTRAARDTATPLKDAAIACSRRLNRELGLGVAVSRRSGLYIVWDFVLGLSEVTAGASLPLLNTHNGIVILSRMAEANVVALVERHNEKFGRSQLWVTVDLIKRLRSLRGLDHVSGRPPGYPNVVSICFYLADEQQSEELLLSVVVPASKAAALQASVVATVRRSLKQHLVHAFADAPHRLVKG